MTFVDEGDRQLKNIERPVKVYSISQDGESTALQLGAMVDAGTRPVVAILPFSNMGTAGEDDYFADGLTEDIITALSRFRELLVIARNSTFRFKNQAVDVSSVGRELNAGYVLEGSIRRAASRVRITAQLIRVSDGTHVWADRYDRNIEDIFDVQDEVTQTIAANLGVRLQDAAREQAMRKNHADLNAYDCVLRSRRFTQTLVASEHSNARDLLEKAIKLDPQKAYARIWLAIIHFFRHENEGFYKEAERALALNPHDPEILAEAGHYYTF
ncbi:MAG: adenylate cyclase, partial [Gammaproteobacteria bacterium]